MASRISGSSGSGERAHPQDLSPLRQNWTITLIPQGETDDPECTFHSKNGAFSIGRTVVNANPEAQDAATEQKSDYNTSCPVVSRSHARISWQQNGDVVVVDSNSHHGTYINDSLTRCTPGVAYRLSDQDTVSFGKGIFKEGKFHQPHTVLVRLNVGDLTPTRSRTGTYGLRQQRFTSVGSQSDHQAEKIRSEVQRLGRRKDVAQKQRRQIQDVSSRLDYLEKKALDKSAPQEIELRLMALERHYEGLLEKLTVIEHNLTRGQGNDDESEDEYERRQRRRRAVQRDEEGEDTDDDEPVPSSATTMSKPSLTSTVAMVVAGGVAVWTALALS